MDAGEMVAELRFYLRSEARARTLDRSLRDDLVQEALIVIVEVVNRYRGRPTDDLIRLAKRSATNRMTDLMRRRRSYEKYVGRFATRGEPTVDPSEQAATDDMFQFIEGKLQPHEADVLRLAREGYEVPDMVEKLRRSRSALYRDADRVAKEVRRWWQ